LLSFAVSLSLFFSLFSPPTFCQLSSLYSLFFLLSSALQLYPQRFNLACWPKEWTWILFNIHSFIE
jgi:hypothetical protein